MDAEGIIPTSEKLKAISAVDTSGDVKQLRSYLWLIHYNAKFCTPVMYRAASNTQTADEGTYVGKVNTPECDKAITQCNEVLCAQQVLVDSDSRRPSRLLYR